MKVCSCTNQCPSCGSCCAGPHNPGCPARHNAPTQHINTTYTIPPVRPDDLQAILKMVSELSLRVAKIELQIKDLTADKSDE